MCRQSATGSRSWRCRPPGSAARRCAVLLPRRGQAVPMDQARLIDSVFDAYAERFSDLGYDTGGAVSLTDAEHRGGYTVHLDRAALQLEDSDWSGALARTRYSGALCPSPWRASRRRSGGNEQSAARYHDGISLGGLIEAPRRSPMMTRGARAKRWAAAVAVLVDLQENTASGSKT